MVDIETITQSEQIAAHVNLYVNMPEVSTANCFSMNMSKKSMKRFKLRSQISIVNFLKKWLVSIFTFKSSNNALLEPPIIAWF